MIKQSIELPDNQRNFMKTKGLVLVVGMLNFIYFFVEFFIALDIISISLFADSIDFLEDAFTNFIILIGLYLGLKNRVRLGYILILFLMIPSFLTLFNIIEKFFYPTVPDGISLSSVALGALAVNLFCAALMMRFKSSQNTLLLAAFLSARNDALANIAMMVAGVLTLFTTSLYPDLVVGIGVFLLNLDASKAVYLAMKREKGELDPP